MEFKTYIILWLLLPNLLLLCKGQNWIKSPRLSKKSLNCTTLFTNEIIQLIMDYAKWRNVAHLFIVDESIKSGCNIDSIRKSLKCFNANKISLTFQRKFHFQQYPDHKVERILMISFLKQNFNDETYLEQANLISFTNGYFIWFNIVDDYDLTSVSKKKFLETLASSAINLAVDLTIAVLTSNSSLNQKENQIICKRKNQVMSISLEKANVKTFLPFVHTCNESREEHAQYCNTDMEYSGVSYCVLQVYKIRRFNNASLVVLSLGHWNNEIGTEKLKPFQSVELRTNFYGFPLFFGKKKFTQDANIADENIIEDDNDEENMYKISDYITTYLNAKEKTIVFPHLGLKDASGNWTGLLGAIVQQEVDVGLDSVIKTPERYNDMSFSHNIMISIRNIYVKPEESHSARDIYLVPFGSKMLLCVLATGVIFAVIMSLYITVYTKVGPRECFPRDPSPISDAILWCWGIFSMQGSLIHPKTFSGNFIIVISLLFALIIYNSYSAFITSILSVKLTKIRTVADLLKSDYGIGYTKNSQDEIYLRSMNNESQLNEIYLRGYLDNNISNITEGLIKATKGNYGFFATSHIARKQFLNISSYKCKYDIMEIPVASTKNNVGFPMAVDCPYRKLINMCIIKMFESGVHNFIVSLIAPKLPECEKQKTYKSARLNDLTTSFLILGLGIILGIFGVLMECLWKKKKKLHAVMTGQQKTFRPKFQFSL